MTRNSTNRLEASSRRLEGSGTTFIVPVPKIFTNPPLDEVKSANPVNSFPLEKELHGIEFKIVPPRYPTRVVCGITSSSSSVPGELPSILKPNSPPTEGEHGPDSLKNDPLAVSGVRFKPGITVAPTVIVGMSKLNPSTAPVAVLIVTVPVRRVEALSAKVAETLKVEVEPAWTPSGAISVKSPMPSSMAEIVGKARRFRNRLVFI